MFIKFENIETSLNNKPLGNQVISVLNRTPQFNLSLQQLLVSPGRKKKLIFSQIRYFLLTLKAKSKEFMKNIFCRNLCQWLNLIFMYFTNYHVFHKFDKTSTSSNVEFDLLNLIPYSVQKIRVQLHHAGYQDSAEKYIDNALEEESKLILIPSESICCFITKTSSIIDKHAPKNT